MALQDEIDQVRADLTIVGAEYAALQAKLKVLRGACPHANKTRHSDYTGDSWHTCDDCGGSSEQGWN